MADFTPLSEAGFEGNVEDRRSGRGKAGRGPQHPDWYRFQPPTQDAPIDGPLAALLDVTFNALSRQMAGGERIHVNDLLPGALDPLEGTVPEEFLPEVDPFDWFDPTLWSRATEEGLIGVDMSGMSPATGPGREGNGADWFRGGEAPSNYVNRHNPLYKARRNFAMSIAPKINELFGTTAGGVGYLRPRKASDDAPGGRSGNSDHYSGGAIDFYGSVEELDSLRAWLVEQPYTSFIRWRSESHGGASGTEKGAHLHVSFDLGWVAQNWFGERTLPDVRAVASTRTAPVASPRLPDSPDTEMVAPELVRGRPS